MVPFQHLRRFHGVSTSASAIAMMLALATPALAQVAVTVNGSEVDFTSAPIIQAGRVFVPLRGVFERLGASVDYADGAINATGSGGRDIALHIGSTQATIDGQPDTIDVAPFIVGATTFVPLRFISQALGATVAWDESSRLVSISLAGSPENAGYVVPASDTDVEQAPPPMPVYDQPPVPAPDDLWQPGYWAWGAFGYFWVPGTWVSAPQPGYLWTPGYWAYNNNRYGWHGGYWASSVGFYGGINYGFGYFGHGYVGGRWHGDGFQYNTAVSHVNVTIVKNVYVDRTVIINNNTTTRISYNGGPRGIAARPTAPELRAANSPHIGLTVEQRQHVLVASKDRRQLATFNRSRPPVVTSARPLTAARVPAALVPVHESDRVGTRITPTERPPAYAAPAAKPPLHLAPGEAHPVQPVEPALQRPVQPVEPELRRPVQPVAPHPVAPQPVAPQPAAASHAPAVRTYPAPDQKALAPFVRPVPPVRTIRPNPPAYVAPPQNVPAVHAIAPVRPPAPIRVAPAMHAPPRPNPVVQPEHHEPDGKRP